MFRSRLLNYEKFGLFMSHVNTYDKKLKIALNLG